MIYEAHIAEPDRIRVIKFDRDTDEDAIAWAEAQWESGVWTMTASGYVLRRQDGNAVHLRERRNG